VREKKCKRKQKKKKRKNSFGEDKVSYEKKKKKKTNVYGVVEKKPPTAPIKLEERGGEDSPVNGESPPSEWEDRRGEKRGDPSLSKGM